MKGAQLVLRDKESDGYYRLPVCFSIKEFLFLPAVSIVEPRLNFGSLYFENVPFVALKNFSAFDNSFALKVSLSLNTSGVSFPGLTIALNFEPKSSVRSIASQD